MPFHSTKNLKTGKRWNRKSWRQDRFFISVFKMRKLRPRDIKWLTEILVIPWGSCCLKPDLIAVSMFYFSLLFNWLHFILGFVNYFSLPLYLAVLLKDGLAHLWLRLLHYSNSKLPSPQGHTARLHFMISLAIRSAHSPGPWQRTVGGRDMPFPGQAHAVFPHSSPHTFSFHTWQWMELYQLRPPRKTETTLSIWNRESNAGKELLQRWRNGESDTTWVSSVSYILEKVEATRWKKN